MVKIENIFFTIKTEKTKNSAGMWKYVKSYGLTRKILRPNEGVHYWYVLKREPQKHDIQYKKPDIKGTYCMIPVTWNIENRHIRRDRKQICGGHGLSIGGIEEINGNGVSFWDNEIFWY